MHMPKKRPCSLRGKVKTVEICCHIEAMVSSPTQTVGSFLSSGWVSPNHHKFHDFFAWMQARPWFYCVAWPQPSTTYFQIAIQPVNLFHSHLAIFQDLSQPFLFEKKLANTTWRSKPHIDVGRLFALKAWTFVPSVVGSILEWKFCEHQID